MHLADHEISQYSDALRNKTERNLPSNILEHVEECLECKYAILELISLLGEIDDAEEIKPHQVKDLPRRKIPSYWKAAVFAFTILLTGYFFLTLNEGKKQKIPAISESVQSVNSKTIPSNELNKSLDNNKKLTQNNLAENELYSPIPEYELTCGEIYRSAIIEIISPSLSEKSKGLIKFNISFHQKANRFLTIFNNKNIQIFHKQFDNNSFIYETSFSPGLYYWKVETNSDLLFLGKFIIER